MISGLNRKENLLDVILNTVSDGITLIDKDLKIQYHSRVKSFTRENRRTSLTFAIKNKI